MNPKVEDLLQDIPNKEAALELQMALARAELQVRIEDGRIGFDNAVRKRTLLMVLAGMRHNMRDNGDKRLRRVTIYATVQHAADTVQRSARGNTGLPFTYTR